MILRFDIHNLTPTGTPARGAPVSVALEPEGDGRHWRGVTASSTRPTTGDYLVGRIDSTRWGSPRVQFGIEAFYMQEGKGLAWEQAARDGDLTAEIAVAPRGPSETAPTSGGQMTWAGCPVWNFRSVNNTVWVGQQML